MATPVEPITKELVLPYSGLKVLVTNRRMKVKDNAEAYQLVGGEAFKHPIKLMAAKVALVATLSDGSSIPYEDILEWDEDDLTKIIEIRDDPAFFQTPGEPS